MVALRCSIIVKKDSAETIMRRSTVVKKDTASCDIVHGSSRPKIYVKRVMRRTAIVKKDKALSLTLAAPKDEASNTYTNQGAQV
jgi:hypothetical protein